MVGNALNGRGRVRASRHTVTVALSTARTAPAPRPTSGRTQGATPRWTTAASASTGRALKRRHRPAAPTRAPAHTPPAAAPAPTAGPKAGTNSAQATSSRPRTRVRSSAAARRGQGAADAESAAAPGGALTRTSS